MIEIDKTLNATYCTKEENLKIVSCQIAEPYPYLVLPLRLCLLALILFVCSREGSGKREREKILDGEARRGGEDMGVLSVCERTSGHESFRDRVVE